MLNNKLNYKLLNCSLIMVIIFLLYKTGDLWIGTITKLGNLLLPFILAFVIAYVLYPAVKFLEKKKLKKGLAITLVLSLLASFIALICALVGPSLFNQISGLFTSIIKFLNEVSIEGNFNLSGFEDTITNVLNSLIGKMGTIVSEGAINVIGSSINIITILAISFFCSIYFLIDMDYMRSRISKMLRKKSKKLYKYVKTLDTEMMNYLAGFLKIMIISFFEYSIVFSLIGHPDALLLGFTAMIAPLIPYFGGIMNNILAAIVAFTVSPALLIRTLIASFILTTIDGNLINPLVYGKTNSLKPILVVMGVFIFGGLFGIVGIIISMPATIFIATTLKFFSNELKDKIEDIKEDLKK